MNLVELEKIRESTLKLMRERGIGAKYIIKVDMGSAGRAAGAGAVYHALLSEIHKRNLKNVKVIQTGEMGFDSMEPMVKVEIKGSSDVYYGKVDEDIARQVISDHVINGHILNDFVISMNAPEEESEEE